MSSDSSNMTEVLENTRIYANVHLWNHVYGRVLASPKRVKVVYPSWMRPWQRHIANLAAQEARNRRGWKWVLRKSND